MVSDTQIGMTGRSIASGRRWNRVPHRRHPFVKNHVADAVLLLLPSVIVFLAERLSAIVKAWEERLDSLWYLLFSSTSESDIVNSVN